MNWIKTSERLPEETEEYIVFGGNQGTVTTMEFHAKNQQWWSDIFNQYVDSTLVTHWMPLPEPPKHEHIS